MVMSDRFTHSFKTALAVTLAYGFALWFDWDKPMWAAFAVILISLSTFEASLYKGGQRLVGSLLAAIVALLLVAAFSQDRWWFMLCQASWLAFCAYRMSSGGRAYLWFCAGFVSAIITANGGPDAVDVFSVATIRTLETCLGIMCYTVVFVLLWPVRAQAGAPAADAPNVPRVERLNQAARVFLAYCGGFLLVIYVPDFPGNYGFLGMLAPFAILLANSPQVQPGKLLQQVLLSVLCVSPVYVFLMPLLSGFAQLAAVIFLVCFAISYVLHRPEQAMGRTLGLAFFAVVTGISNEQSYGFVPLANTVIMFLLLLLVIYMCSGIRVFEVSDRLTASANRGAA